ARFITALTEWNTKISFLVFSTLTRLWEVSNNNNNNNGGRKKRKYEEIPSSPSDVIDTVFSSDDGSKNSWEVVGSSLLCSSPSQEEPQPHFKNKK
ncbi:hypothetical protein HN51_055073, partial [Arachis hypogaea]